MGRQYKYVEWYNRKDGKNSGAYRVREAKDGRYTYVQYEKGGKTYKYRSRDVDVQSWYE